MLHGRLEFMPWQEFHTGIRQQHAYMPKKAQCVLGAWNLHSNRMEVYAFEANMLCKTQDCFLHHKHTLILNMPALHHLPSK